MVAHRSFEAKDRARQVALDAGAARAAGAMMSMRGYIRGKGFVTAGAHRIGVRSQRPVLFDFRIVHICVAVRASDAASQEALTLPETDGIVRKASRPAIWPVGRISSALLAAFANRQKDVEVTHS